MDKSLKFMGFDKLQDLGCNGQGLNALVYEDTDDSHGGNVRRSLLEDGGGLTVFREYFGVRSADAGQRLVEFVHANNIKLINLSLASNHVYPEFNAYLKQLRDEGVIIVCAAGNEGEEGHKGIGHDDDIAIMVGGATVRSDGKLYRDPHSGIDEELDYMSLSLYGLQGTSFKAPIVLRMIGCILQYLGDMDTDGVKKVLNKLCIDMDEVGVDDFTGNGLPVIDIAVLDSFKEDIMKLTKFDDVEEGRWSEEAIALVSETGVMNGVSDTEFGTKEPLTREQMAQVLANLHNAGVIDLKK